MIKGKGICCKFVIANKPENSKVTERAIPVSLFEDNVENRSKFLKKWCKDNRLSA